MTKESLEYKLEWIKKMFVYILHVTREKIYRGKTVTTKTSWFSMMGCTNTIAVR